MDDEIEAFGKLPPHADHIPDIKQMVSGLAFRGIKYRRLKPYKYRLETNAVIQTGLDIKRRFYAPFGHLSEGGRLWLREGYAWDGASGPAIDTRTILRGSLAHDALYQMLRLGVLPESMWKDCNDVLYRLCLEDGMSKIRASWVRWAVGTWIAKRNTLPEADNSYSEVLTAP